MKAIFIPILFIENYLNQNPIRICWHGHLDQSEPFDTS